jgi:aminobenzoyl-glutamate transport protein
VSEAQGGFLGRVERLGNALPDPVTLFVIGALLVALGSAFAAGRSWTVEKSVTRVVTEPVLLASGEPLLDPQSGEPLSRAVLDDAGRPLQERVEIPLRATSLLSADGLFWILASAVDNFMQFPPLGVVLVGMLGIGLAERTGFIGALLKAILLAVPSGALTPTIFFVGVMSSVGLDAGYVVLPPVAAALFQAVGRSPLVGLAAVFAGVSAGFSANLVITSLDPLLARLSTASAQLVAPGYAVAETSNWWFMIASTVLLVGVGWAVTAWWVEPRYSGEDAGGAAPAPAADAIAGPLTDTERRGLLIAVNVACATGIVIAVATLVPGFPLHGLDGVFPRWVRVIVPLLFLGFLLPGMAYGIATGSLKSDRDVASVLGDTMSAMGPYIVLAFFAGQFIAWFAHSGLGEMLAITGGRALAAADLPASGLMAGFIVMVGIANMLIGSMSAKYAFLAPVFVPMFMQVGISPELTQVAYRIGDSVSNVITPLNPYVVIILVFMQRYAPKAGIGTLVALMLPYAAVFALVWTTMLTLWMLSGLPLGPDGPLTYAPTP